MALRLVEILVPTDQADDVREVMEEAQLAGPWHISRASAVSTALYATITVGASAMWMLASPAPILSLAEELAVVALAATAGGLALATIRERSLSLWPGVGLQFAGGLASLAFWYWLGTAPALPY